MITDRPRNKIPAIYTRKRYLSFGEWLYGNRIAANCPMRAIVEATGLSRPTIRNRENDRRPPEELTKRISIDFIDNICSVMPGADRDDGLYLAGWTTKIRPSADDRYLGASAEIAAIAIQALRAIAQICETAGIVIEEDDIEEISLNPRNMEWEDERALTD
jgi:transcriptional regulator with XRE-family HTH domain